MTAPDERLLRGIRVLEFTHMVPGAFAGRILADLGADVIKLEPPGGDPLRQSMRIPGTSVSASFNHANAGKLGCCIDLKTAEGLDLAKRLASDVDIVIESFVPGVLDRLGLGFGALQEVNPSLLYCSVSSYGQTGELAHRVGGDAVGQAMSGMSAMIGEPDGPPLMVTNGIADAATGTQAAVAILAALWSRGRERTGAGRQIDVAMVDTMVAMDFNDSLALASGGSAPLQRAGGHHPSASPSGVFRAREGYIIVNTFGVLWDRLCAAMGTPELLDDPRFSTLDLRIEHRDALTRLIEDWLQGFPDDATALRTLQDARVVAAPVLTPAQAVAHPLLQDRRMVREVEHPDLGRLLMLAMPYRFEGIELAVSRAPSIGEHNEFVLREYLGLDEGATRRLAEAGVIQSDGPASG